MASGSGTLEEGYPFVFVHDHGDQFVAFTLQIGDTKIQVVQGTGFDALVMPRDFAGISFHVLLCICEPSVFYGVRLHGRKGSSLLHQFNTLEV